MDFKTQPYPRPGFTRPNLNWTSLNGPWDFLFDDEDTGLSKGWPNYGLPDTVALSRGGSDEKSNKPNADESIVQKIASGTQQLIKNNNLLNESNPTENSKRTIQVPFVFQAPASGINERGVHEVLWYERTVTDPRTAEDRANGATVLLRFGAVDYESTVWVNTRYCGGHRGGHVPFDVDTTNALLADGYPQRITIRVYDSAYDLTQPRGKQYWNAQPESIFYTPSGGIWQSVWMEVVPRARIADSSGGTVLRSNDIASGTLACNVVVQGRRAGENLSVQATASFEGQLVSLSEKTPLSKETNSVSLSLNMKLSGQMQRMLPESSKTSHPANDDSCWRDGVALWSPEHPQLYDISIQLTNAAGDVVDTVDTYTGMRSISWTGGLWKLNDKPYFQALCLDQGYWPNTLMTPPTQNSLRQDIELSKKMGFNGCRKHQKVEDAAFYYWADKLGYLVWGEMASAYQFSDAYVDRFNQEWTEAVKLVINSPCVVTWTPVNESWAYTALKDNVTQRNHIRALYFMTK
jgi:beta-galactosidase/beta-glucuronidase